MEEDKRENEVLNDFFGSLIFTKSTEQLLRESRKNESKYLKW
jgi:hypothetical protein